MYFVLKLYISLTYKLIINIMKTSELIKKLTVLMEKHGDKELRFTVKDYFSIHGEEMNFNLKVGDTDGMPTDWHGCFTNNDTTSLFFTLNPKEEKKPKITYRK